MELVLVLEGEAAARERREQRGEPENESHVASRMRRADACCK
jgi:hypothetical protein